MAFQTTQNTSQTLLRNLFFRNNANEPISSFYVPYANGAGRTFWGETLRPENLSSFSTAAFSSLNAFAGDLSSFISTYTAYSSPTVSTQYGLVTQQLLSTTAVTASSLTGFQTTQAQYSTQLEAQYVALTQALAIQTNQVYVSSLAIAQSTYNFYRNPSSIAGQISSLNVSIQSAVSSLSTATRLGDLQTYSTVSTLLTLSGVATTLTTRAYTDSAISTLSSILFINSEYADFSTSLNLALLSASQGVTNLFSSQLQSTTNTWVSVNSSLNSTTEWELSSTRGLQIQYAGYAVWSTAFSTNTYAGISSQAAPLFAESDQRISAYFSTVVDEITYISTSTQANTDLISTISTQTYASISSFNETYIYASTSLGLSQIVFDQITVSSILHGVYSTFQLYETDTALLVTSTVNAIDLLQSTYYSTILNENASTTRGYFTEFFSNPSFFYSSLGSASTLVNNYLSSLISVVGAYEVSTFVTPAIQSTAQAKYAEGNSTLYGIYGSQMNSTNQLMQSSILGNLSTPTANGISTFTSQGQRAISSFQGGSLSSLLGYSTIFGNQFSTIQQVTGVFLQSTVIGANSTYSSYFGGLMGSYSTLLNALQDQSTLVLSSQVQFQSTITSFNQQFNTYIASTSSAYYINTNLQQTAALNTLQVSSVQGYSTYTNNLLIAANTAAFSSLYTEQRISLGGNNFTGTLDFATYTNFMIQIRDPLINGSSTYSVRYNENTIPSLSRRTGLICIDVSTPTSAYSTNQGLLDLQLYRWGLPTSMWSQFYPTISNANYMTMYEYTIENSTIYTNFVNIYPSLSLTNLTIQTPTNANANGFYWRGTPLQLQWSTNSALLTSNYSIPYYYPEVRVDMIYNNTAFVQYGPFNYLSSQATVNLPYYTGGYVNPVQTEIRAYIVGNPLQPTALNVNVLLPQLNYLTLTPSTNRFLVLADIAANADNTGTNTLLNNPNISLFDGSGNSNASFEAQRIEFQGTPASYLSYFPDPDFAMGTGDFTIEWYMYSRNTGNASPRIFQVGTGGTGFVFSIETLAPSYTNRPTLNIFNTFIYNFSTLGSYISNKWTHMALTRSLGNLRFFVDGSILNTYSITQNLNNSNTLAIGTNSYNGSLASFRWTKGTALYGATNFTIPLRPLEVSTNTKLLLQTTNMSDPFYDSSGLGKYPVYSTQVTYPNFVKGNAVDGNPSTYTIGPSTFNTPVSAAQLRIEPLLQTTLTSVSSITVTNMPTSCNVTRTDGRFDFGEMWGTQLQFGVNIGTNFYTSTIVLTSSAVQTFRL